MYRPFVRRVIYFSNQLNEMRYQTPLIFGDGGIQNRCIVFTDPTAQKPWMISAVDQLPDLHFVGAAAGTLCFPIERLGDNNALHDNITDWGLKQFRQHYEQPSSVHARGSKAQKITKETIFYYCYAVLHDPLYQERCAQNLKREFPRIPFYADFWQWVAWGESLMNLHIGYESVEPFKLERIDIIDEKVRAAGLQPKALLRANKDAGSTSHWIARRRCAAFHTTHGTTNSATAVRWNGCSTSTRKKNRKIPPSARNSTPTASPITRKR